jgi:hypothetical protein
MVNRLLRSDTSRAVQTLRRKVSAQFNFRLALGSSREPDDAGLLEVCGERTKEKTETEGN